MYLFIVLYSYFMYGLYCVNMKFVNVVSNRNCMLYVLVYKFVYLLIGFNVMCFLVVLNMLMVCILNIIGGNDFWCDWDFGVDG